MTHDPLCARTPTGVHYVGTCTCNLIAKVRADERDNTLDDAINLLEEMNCKRLWWDDMLTWCISVNEAIYNIDNLRGKKEGV